MSAKNRESRKSYEDAGDSGPPLTQLWNMMVDWVRGGGRTLLMLGSVVAGFVAVAAVAYLVAMPYVGSSPNYTITRDSVYITPDKPVWIRGDVCQQAFEAASLPERQSLIDAEVSQTIEKAFRLHPWVKDVVRVKTSYPARADVELVYRQPVCMVDSSRGILPVDSEGVLLPTEDFTIAQKLLFPRLVHIDSTPLASAGQPWGDPRVTAGARIARELCGVWTQWRLSRIEPSMRPIPKNSNAFHFDLVTRKGTRITWGVTSADPKNAAGEQLPISEKMARLAVRFKQTGTLDPKDEEKDYSVFDLPASPSFANQSSPASSATPPL